MAPPRGFRTCKSYLLARGALRVNIEQVDLQRLNARRLRQRD